MLLIQLRKDKDVHMTLGEKIKFLRKKKGNTQEYLAEKLNVSRSAIAKWETDTGIPEISNLKMISELFSVSVDTLLDDTKNIEDIDFKRCVKDSCSTYVGEYSDIELTGWNDGVFDVLILGNDEDFYFYQYSRKEKTIHGLIGKKYITSIKPTKRGNITKNNDANINSEFFCGKPVFIEVAHKEGLIKGFFDFKNDDYQNVIIQSFSDTEVELEYGGEINIADICKIEELGK